MLMATMIVRGTIERAGESQMNELSRESVVAEVQEIARRLGVDTLRREDFARESAISLYQVSNLFPDDGWRGVLEAAGLQVTFQAHQPLMTLCWRRSIASSVRWGESQQPFSLITEAIFHSRSTKSGLAVSRVR